MRLPESDRWLSDFLRKLLAIAVWVALCSGIVYLMLLINDFEPPPDMAQFFWGINAAGWPSLAAWMIWPHR